MFYKYLLLSGFMLIIFSSRAQECRWQQHVSYLMEIDMEVNSHQFSGKQSLTYTNNSPDTLSQVFYHLYLNAFQPGSMMDVRSRTIKDPDPRVLDRIAKLKEDQTGFLKILSLKQDGQTLAYEVSGTILEVALEKQLLPGSQTVFEMEFLGQVPLQIRRTGRDNREGIAYSMAQWYPKLAEYDHMGWHANPYVGREFYGVWGDFEVILHIDKKYMVAATGYLQNPGEVGHGFGDNSRDRSSKGKTTWHFKAPNVHDFVWAADPDYRHIQAQVPQGPTLHFYYQPEPDTENWEALPQYTVKAFQYMNENFGKYPYLQYSVIQGGDGGMEYPMATLINGKKSLRSLVSLTVHELVHSWYQMVLANNESLYAWMDEGFTDFAAAEVMSHLFPDNNPLHAQSSHYRSYFSLVKSGLEEPMTTHADHYKYNRAYGTASYNKGSIFLRQLSYVIGEQAFKKGLLRYFEEWKFRHPQPNDFKRVMEKVSGLELDWYLEHWINSTNTIDYGIASVSYDENSTFVTLERYGAMMMPIDLAVKFNDGTGVFYHIPLRIMRGAKPQEIPSIPWHVAPDWPWTHPQYVLAIPGPPEQIEYLEIDPSKRMADIQFENNRLDIQSYLKKNP